METLSTPQLSCSPINFSYRTDLKLLSVDGTGYILTLQIDPSLLALHVPGQHRELLSYITGERDFPAIDLVPLAGWRRELVASGHLRQYVERLRTLYTTGTNSEDTYLACPLCPMPLCGVGLDAPGAIDTSCAHAMEHLSVYRQHQDAPVTTVASL
jgi:hypothetical protein